MMRRLGQVVLAVAIAGLLAVAAVLAGCQQPLSETTSAKDVTVRIRNLTFQPTTLTVTPGTTVTWVNDDDTAHTTTSDTTGTGSWVSEPLNPGASFKHTFKDRGDFTYHCDIHPYLTGDVTVR